jgi:lysyl-tRNA synthetase, class I
MFWADRIAGEVRKRFGAGKPILVRDEKTPSGRVHVGSMRGVAIHGAIAEALGSSGVFKYEFNDLDPMDGFPEYLPESFREHMGKPLRNIPSPDGKAKNFAEYFADEFKEVIRGAGFEPEFYNVSALYTSGQMDELIRTALDRAADIRRIYREVSGSQKPDDWYPLSVFCEACGKVGTTKVFAWNGTEVSYRCEPDLVSWAKGCRHEGTVSPFGGKAKFPFKVEWPAKWKALGVMVEGAGKDHSTKGGARDVAAHIAQEIFGYEPPHNAPYEFFLVGGQKMSSSKGRGSSAKEIADLLPAKIFRLALLGKDINQAINFDPEGDTVPTLYDQYDKLAENYWKGAKDDYARLFEFLHAPAQKSLLEKVLGSLRSTRPFSRRISAPVYLPRFSQVAFMVQMPHLKLEDEVARLKGSALTAADKAELEERATYAKRWLEAYAPEKYVFKLQDTVPEAARGLSNVQKGALAALADYIESERELSGERLHARLHEIKEERGLSPAEFFGAIYTVFLDKKQGPQAGWFLASLPREFVLGRLKQAVV